MKTMLISIPLNKELQLLLAEGARRTHLSNQELLLRTLRLHLHEVIEREARTSARRITNVEPWPRNALAKAYKQAGKSWEAAEATAASAQGRPP